MEFKKENILGLVQFVGTREEFLQFAGKITLQLHQKEFKLQGVPMNECTMYIVGTVKGEIRNQIIFYKDEKPSSPEKETEKPNE